FAEFGRCGIGPGRGRAGLERIEHLDLAGAAREAGETPGDPASVDLAALRRPVDRLSVRFVTPTELKADGRTVAQPEFPVLFGRLRDRIATLRALYGAGPLELDFRALGERAAAVRLTRCDLNWERAIRRSGRTGQVHSLGGFTGEAEYQGNLAEFVPWLRAGYWVGAGRQTVWGKGVLETRLIPGASGVAAPESADRLAESRDPGAP
ncbi:MAG TPA: CRISPR system precrRNA processing endoribonuclease RAMP protein Cas6, partial [Candidatus Sulfopaludibacter sp.]|nr:CRISPR system precrRNA processing endoribonuclease RAMP protein Cas6 [Candidatus Sulfopaludibacter sp.]